MTYFNMLSSVRIALFIGILLTITVPAFNALDNSFVPVVESKPGSSLPVYSHAVQSDGKVLVGGLFRVIGGKVRRNLARLNVDGTTDDTFQVGIGPNENVYTIVVQSDGKVLIGGLFTTYNGVGRTYIARLNADGSLDTTFTSTLSDIVYEIVIQADGKLVVGGEFTTVNGAPVNKIVRLNPDGSTDGTFNVTNTEVSNPVKAIAVQSDGKLMVGGQNITFGSAKPFLRLNSDGSTDTSFNIGSGIAGAVNEIVIQPNGNYLIGGSFNGFNGGSSPNNIARINADGTIDAGFTSGFSAFDEVKKIVLATDGKAFVIGNFTFFNFTTSRGIVKINADGTLDSSFNTGGGVDVTNPISGIDILPDGKVLMSGFFSSYGGSPYAGIVRINTDGTSDASFAPRTGVIGTVADSAVQPDGKILIGGTFSYVNGTPRERIARLNPDGTTDDTFTIGTGVTGTLSSIYLQSDGKILIGGNFTSYNGVVRDNVARLNSDGTLDTTFDSGLMDAPDVVDDIAQTFNGKIVIGGLFGSVNGTTRVFLAQLNQDGSVDTGFNHPILDGRVRTLLPQPDGKLFIGGSVFTMSQPQAFFKGIVRLNMDGTMDTSFATGTGANGFVWNIAQQPDGKLLIGGGFLSYNGVARNGIARINSDGSMDTGFNHGVGALGQVNELGIDSQGRIFGAGATISFDGTTVNRIFGLNSDGTLDPDFPGGSGSPVAINALSVQPDDNIVIGCGSEFNGIPRGGLARLTNLTGMPTPTPTSTPVVTPTPTSTPTATSTATPITCSTPGSLDLSFDGDGKVTTPIGTGSEQAYAVAIHSDGKIVVAGYSFIATSVIDFAVVRYNADGSLDTSFDGDGKVTTGVGTTDIAYSVAIQSDGKIVIAGYSLIGSTRDFVVIRYNTDGTLDTSFDGDGKVITQFGTSDEIAYSVAIQPDQKIVVAGYSVGSTFDFAVVRYNTDGSLDTSFDGDGKVTTPIGSGREEARSVAIHSDGKIVAAGFSFIDTNNDFAVVRYNADGSLDTSFDGDGKVTTSIGISNDTALSVAIQADGRVVAAGVSVIPPNNDFALVRYNTDGSLDTSFDGDGKVTTAIGTSSEEAQSVGIQSDGKIVAAGYTDNGLNFDFAMGRYNTDGSLDTTFDGDGKVTTQIGSGEDNAYGVKIQPDGRVVAAGFSLVGITTDFAVVRYNGGCTSQTSTPTNTPTATPAAVTITGAVTYGNAISNPVPPRFVKNVSLSSTVGSPAVGPVITGTPGTYTLTGFGAGSYTIKPTKPGGSNGAITSNDAARIAQGVTGSLPFVSNNQRFAADVTGNGGVSSGDAAKIAQFVAGLPFSPPNFTGEWRFFTSNLPAFPAGAHPQERTYASVTSNVTGEDYVGILIGETSGNWNPATHPRPAGGGAAEVDVGAERKSAAFPLSEGQSPGMQGPERGIAVELPQMTAADGKEIVVPVNVQGLADKGVISYEFDLRYDPLVIQPLDECGRCERERLAAGFRL